MLLKLVQSPAGRDDRASLFYSIVGTVNELIETAVKSPSELKTKSFVIVMRYLNFISTLLVIFRKFTYCTLNLCWFFFLIRRIFLTLSRMECAADLLFPTFMLRLYHHVMQTLQSNGKMKSLNQGPLLSSLRSLVEMPEVAKSQELTTWSWKVLHIFGQR